MKRIFSILFAVVLVLSFSLVPAAPVGAQPTQREFLDQTRLAAAGGGTAEWVTTLPDDAEVYNGDFAAHMAVPADADISNIIHMGIQGDGPLLLSQITTVKFWEYLVTFGGSGAGAGGSAAIIFYLNDPGTDPPAEGTNPPEWGKVEDALTFHTYGTWATQDAWSLRDLTVVGQDWQGYADSIGIGTVEPLSYWLDSNNWDNADWEVCFISVCVGAGNWAGYEGYIDDFIVEWTGSDYEDTYLTDPRVVNETQNTGHNYIQDAIDDADSGDTIIVAAGTYGPFIVDGKTDLTIQSNSVVTVQGVQSVSTNYDNRDAVIFVSDSADIMLEGLTIGPNTGKTLPRDYGVIYENSTGEINGCVVSPNTMGDMGSIAIGIWDGSDVDVESCTVENYGRIGVFIYNGSIVGIIGGSIEGQVYTGELEVCYGVEVEGAWGSAGPETASVVVINDVEIYNCNNTFSTGPSWESAGILINGWLEHMDAADSTVIMENNDIHDNYIGIYAVKTPSSYAHFNNIYDNHVYGVISAPLLWGPPEDTTAVFDATYNWWGDKRGPSRAMGKAKGHDIVKGDRVSPNVRFAPWLR